MGIQVSVNVCVCMPAFREAFAATHSMTSLSFAKLPQQELDLILKLTPNGQSLTLALATHGAPQQGLFPPTT